MKRQTFGELGRHWLLWHSSRVTWVSRTPPPPNHKCLDWPSVWHWSDPISIPVILINRCHSSPISAQIFDIQMSDPMYLKLRMHSIIIHSIQWMTDSSGDRQTGVDWSVRALVSDERHDWHDSHVWQSIIEHIVDSQSQDQTNHKIYWLSFIEINWIQCQLNSEILETNKKENSN